MDGADLVIVHEWTGPAMVAALGRLRAGAAGSPSSSTIRIIGR
ncbi:MAG: hypothetical protein R3C69_18705 [Geminicoccaceae bacterium]